MNFIDPSVFVDKSVKVGYFSVVEKGVKIGKNVTIGNRVTIHEDTVIGDNTTIADGAVVGKPPKPAKTSTVKLSDTIAPLIVDEEVTIGSNSVIYRGAKIGSNTMIADLASVRENVNIGEFVIVGRGVTVENYVEIGSRTKIQSNSYITAYTTLEEHVFIAPCVTTTNDNLMGRTEERFEKIKGAVVKRGARVGGASIILPGIIIEEETFVAAGALVTKNTEAKTLIKGVPAKCVRKVDERELL